jgi:hypothetical protein
MKIRVQYNFQGRDRDYIAQPLGYGVYTSFEEYKDEVLRWFPDAIVTKVSEENTPKTAEIVELEIAQ